MDCDEDKAWLILNALELADGHLGEQYVGSRESHREGGIKNPAQ